MTLSLSDRLTLAMQTAKVSQAELARACGVKPPSVHGWLSGKSKFLRGENLLQAATALGVKPEWLATGSGQMLAHASHPDAPAWMTRRVHWVAHLFDQVEESDEYDSDDDALFAEVFRRTGLPTARLKVLRMEGACPTDAELKALEVGFKLLPGTIDGSDPPSGADQSRVGIRAEVTLAQALEVLVTSIKALPQPARKALSEDFALLAVAPGDAETMLRVLSSMTTTPSTPDTSSGGVIAADKQQEMAALQATAEELHAQSEAKRKRHRAA